MIGLFSTDPRVIAVGEEYLRIVSWNFVASGIVFVTSSIRLRFEPATIR